MCGIFAYLNFNVNRERTYILEVLFNGLRRLEYRGYDSSGIAIDSSLSSDFSNGGCISTVSPSPLVFRKEGNIDSLVKSVYQGEFSSFFAFLLIFGVFWIVGISGFCELFKGFLSIVYWNDMILVIFLYP